MMLVLLLGLRSDEESSFFSVFFPFSFSYSSHVFPLRFFLFLSRVLIAFVKDNRYHFAEGCACLLAQPFTLCQVTKTWAIIGADGIVAALALWSLVLLFLAFLPLPIQGQSFRILFSWNDSVAAVSLVAIKTRYAGRPLFCSCFTLLRFREHLSLDLPGSSKRIWLNTYFLGGAVHRDLPVHYSFGLCVLQSRAYAPGHRH